MYDSVTQERFIIRGICYEPDPLVSTADYASPCDCSNCGLKYKAGVDTDFDYFSDEQEDDIWARDIPYLKSLNVNAVLALLRLSVRCFFS